MSKTKQRTPRTDAECLAMADHLAYEVEMLAMAGIEASWPVVDDEGKLRRNLGIESFALHARALLHVFCPEGRIADDDVLATDFRPDPSKWPQSPGSALDTLRQRTGKQIAHLTWERLKLTAEERAWKVPDVFAALEALLGTFIGAVDRSLLGAHADRVEKAMAWFHAQRRAAAVPSLLLNVGSSATTSSAVLTVSSGGVKAAGDVVALQIVGVDAGPLD